MENNIKTVDTPLPQETKEIKTEQQKENYDITKILATIQEDKICIINNTIIFDFY